MADAEITPELLARIPAGMRIKALWTREEWRPENGGEFLLGIAGDLVVEVEPDNGEPS